VAGISYLLDTNILSEPVVARPDPFVLERIKANSHALAISSVTWQEAVYGMLLLPAGRRREQTEDWFAPTASGGRDQWPAIAPAPFRTITTPAGASNDEVLTALRTCKQPWKQRKDSTFSPASSTGTGSTPTHKDGPHEERSSQRRGLADLASTHHTTSDRRFLHLRLSPQAGLWRVLMERLLKGRLPAPGVCLAAKVR